MRRASAPHHGEICALRFCSQHASSDWLQTGYSSPHPSANTISFRRNSHREQRIANGNSAFVGKCEIVDDSSPLIRVAFDRNDAIGMRLQPLSISLEHGLLLRSNVVAIEGEMDVLYILFHCLLLRRSWNWRLRNGRIFYWPARIIFAVILVWNSRCSEVGLRKRYTDRQEGEQRSFHASTNHTDPRSRKALSLVSAKRRRELSGQYRIDGRMLAQSWAHISFRCRQIRRK